MRTTFVPLVLLAGAMLVWFAFQAFQLASDRQRLSAVINSQEPLVRNSQKLRANLDSLAAQTARLADEGNANARLLVDELRKRGVAINPPAGK